MSKFNIKPYTQNNTEGGGEFPSRLKQFNQWLVTHDTPWNDERHKSPKYPAEGWNDGNTLSFQEAYSRFNRDDETALAFRFDEAGPFVGIDIDDVMQDGSLSDEASKIVRCVSSYTEISTSGNGLHVIAEGEHLDDYKNRSDLAERGHIEVYDESRYFVLTGDVYGDYESVESRTAAVREIQVKYLVKRPTFTFTNRGPSDNEYADQGRGSVTPEQVRRTIHQYVRSDNHGVDAEVLRLWDGSNEGRESASEADMAFMKQLFFWCRGNQQLMDDCFRSSERMRSKWDEQRGDQTYGEMTLQKVCRTNSDTFEGRYVQ